MELLLIVDERNVVRAVNGSAELLGIPPATNIVGCALADVARTEVDWFSTLWAGVPDTDEALTTQVVTSCENGALALDVAAFRLPSPEGGRWSVVALRDSSELRAAEQRLEQAEALFRGWIEQAPAVVYSSSYASPGSTIYVSPHVEALLGYSTTEWSSDPNLWFERLHPDDRERVLQLSSETRATLQPLSMEYRLLARDGRAVWVSDDGIIVRDDDGQPHVWQGMLFDITPRKQAELWLEGQKRVLEQIAQGAPLVSILELITPVIEQRISDVRCAIFLTGSAPSTLRLVAAPSLPSEFARAIDGVPIAPDARTVGAAAYLREPVISHDIAHDDRWALDRDEAQSAGVQACWAIPILSSANHAMGTLAVYVNSARRPDKDEEKLIDAMVQLARIAIERQEMVDHLVFQAFSDHLTSLPNRALLQDRLIQALARARRRLSVVAVIFLDLDRFKAVNDEFGHHAGDQLLKLVAERLRGCVRAEDTVARVGGDEFVILLEDEPDTDEVITVVRRVLSRFEAPFELAHVTVQIMPSIGIAFDFTGFEDPDELVRDADRAMYEAKRRGSGGYVIASAKPEGCELGKV